MQLTDLPVEILGSLPNYLCNIEDFTSLSSTCIILRTVLSRTTPQLILRLASQSAPTFFFPHPYFLTAATARGAAEAALGNEKLTNDLQRAFQGGIDDLYEFCLRHSGITLEEIRNWHLARFSTINPMSDRIDKMAGKQWYATPDFWDGGVSEAYTIECDADRCTYQLLIYGELFGESMRSFIQPGLGLLSFGPETRLEYIKYCVPDWICDRGYPGMEVQHDIGPYAPHETENEMRPFGDQLALHHVLGCGRWTRMWQAVLRQIGSDFDDGEIDQYEADETKASTVSEMRQCLWWAAAMVCGGVEGLSAVTTIDENGTISSKTRQRLASIRKNVEELDDDYLLELIAKTRPFGVYAKMMIAAHPDMRREVTHCTRAYWPGTDR